MSYELELPSGHKITFREPRNKDRKKVIEEYVADNKNKGSSDIEILAGLCLETFDGAPIQEYDPRRRMDFWGIKDVQFYQGVFLDMFTVNSDDEIDRIKEAAKKLLQGPASDS
jgi:hypothetical protein